MTKGLDMLQGMEEAAAFCRALNMTGLADCVVQGIAALRDENRPKRLPLDQWGLSGDDREKLTEALQTYVAERVQGSNLQPGEEPDYPAPEQIDGPEYPAPPPAVLAELAVAKNALELAFSIVQDQEYSELQGSQGAYEMIKTALSMRGTPMQQWQWAFDALTALSAFGAKPGAPPARSVHTVKISLAATDALQRMPKANIRFGGS